MSRKQNGRDKSLQSRSVARLGAVQALYQIEISGAEPALVIDQFFHNRMGKEIEGIDYSESDSKLLTEVVQGAVSQRTKIDELIRRYVSAEWSLERLETIVRAILRAGTFELLALPAVPVRVVIDEYVEIAHAFFSGSEPGFINGVLDCLGRILRPNEMEANVNEASVKAR